MRILIVEDDRKLATVLKKALEEEAHSVMVSFDGKEGLGFAEAGEFDVAVLDVMLPSLDGLSILRRLRSNGKSTPILLLTARDAIADVVKGLDAGADDYLTKPFSFEVLLARLRALSRRRSVEPRTCLQVSNLFLDPATREVRRGRSVLPLTRTEFAVLDCLMRNTGRVLTRNRIIETVWGYEKEIETNTLDVFIASLRNKVDSGKNKKLIHTIRGVGYSLREEEP